MRLVVGSMATDVVARGTEDPGVGIRAAVPVCPLPTRMPCWVATYHLLVTGLTAISLRNSFGETVCTTCCDHAPNDATHAAVRLSKRIALRMGVIGMSVSPGSTWNTTPPSAVRLADLRKRDGIRIAEEFRWRGCHGRHAEHVRRRGEPARLRSG